MPSARTTHMAAPPLLSALCPWRRRSSSSMRRPRIVRFSPAAVFVEEKKQQQHAPAEDSPFLPGVRDVIERALLHAGCAAFSVIYVLIVISIYHADPPLWLLPRPAAAPEVMTDAAVDVAVLWCVCVLSQAAAGALALLLPRHRLLLAYAALVATDASHCMWAGLYIMVFVAPGVFSFWNVVITLVVSFIADGDLHCFRGLILREGEE